MMQVDTNFLCASVNGKFIGNNGNIQINGVATDSRYINAGTLFFALKGEKYDGHDFVMAALKKGAAAAVISRKIDGLSEQCDSKCIILVEDTLQALQDFARAYRLKFDIPVVAVTGSVGKTTTRDIIACCLQTVTKTLQTEANYNNDIGLPLTILKLEETHQAAVVELGMRGPGEIQRLALIAKPTCAVITNVEPVHLETLRSIENIARAKCEVLGEITEGGFAVINGDNNLLLQIADKYPCRKYTFGYNEVCDFQILKVAIQNGGIVITAKLVDHMEEFYFPVPTVKLAENVIAAVAIVTLLGISVEKIRAGLLNYKGSHNRLHSIHLNNGGIIIADRYTTSNMVHQGGKISDEEEFNKYLNWLWNLEFELYKIPIPDKIYFLNIPLNHSIDRIEKRLNKITNGEKKDIHENNYIHLHNAYKNAKRLINLYHWHEIDCMNKDEFRTIGDINEEIYKDIIDNIIKDEVTNV